MVAAGGLQVASGRLVLEDVELVVVAVLVVEDGVGGVLELQSKHFRL